MIVFKTDRLIIRQIEQGDLNNLHAICGNSELMKYVGDGNPLSKEQTQKWIDVTILNYKTKGYGMFAVIHKADMQFIGYCGLVHSNDVNDNELIYALLKNYWGLGLATELATKLINFGFEHFKVQKIYASTDPENEASKHILIKIGFAKIFSKQDEHGLETIYFMLQP
jgi:ribosomal-protein-alanine N-acetyltransferase